MGKATEFDRGDDPLLELSLTKLRASCRLPGPADGVPRETSSTSLQGRCLCLKLRLTHSPRFGLEKGQELRSSLSAWVSLHSSLFSPCPLSEA